MRPRVADLLLDLEVAEPSPLPAIPLDAEALPSEATVEGRVYDLEIPDDDPIAAMIAPPCERCGRACDGSCSAVAIGWDEFGGIEGDD